MMRDDAGPFIVLGVDKDADPATLPTLCAERQEAVRREELHWEEDDMAWALEQLRDPERRRTADMSSLNVDLASGEVRRLERLYRVDGSPPGWETLDPEPPAELPTAELDSAALAAELPAPDVPLELPSVASWLAKYAAAASADPWSVELTG